MNRITLKEFFNIPNCLCYFRIILIPVFFIFYFQADGQMDYYISALILIMSGFTDFLDGFIARKFDMVTDFGKLIDPIADKLTQFSVAVALLYTYSWMWLLVSIIFVKDAMLALASLYLYEKGEKIRGASWWGKVSTAFFDVVVVMLIGLHMPDSIVPTVLIWICAVLMFLSLILYARQLFEMIKETKIHG